TRAATMTASTAVDTPAPPADASAQLQPPLADWPPPLPPVPGLPPLLPPVPGVPGMGVTPPTGGGVPGATLVSSVTLQPSPAADTWNISGWPVSPPPAPAVMLTTQRPDAADALTADEPSPASGAS